MFEIMGSGNETRSTLVCVIKKISPKVINFEEMSSSSSSGASGGFSVAAVEKKLKDLNTTIQSIQGVSQWLIHYRKTCQGL